MIQRAFFFFFFVLYLLFIYLFFFFFCVIDPLTFCFVELLEDPVTEMNSRWIRTEIPSTEPTPMVWGYESGTMVCRDKQNYIDRTAMCKYRYLHSTHTGIAECLCASSRPRELNRPISAPRSHHWLTDFPCLVFARQEYGWSTSTCCRCGSIMVGFYSIRHVNNKERSVPRYRGKLFVICLYR